MKPDFSYNEDEPTERQYSLFGHAAGINLLGGWMQKPQEGDTLPASLLPLRLITEELIEFLYTVKAKKLQFRYLKLSSIAALALLCEQTLTPADIRGGREVVNEEGQWSLEIYSHSFGGVNLNLQIVPYQVMQAPYVLYDKDNEEVAFPPVAPLWHVSH